MNIEISIIIATYNGISKLEKTLIAISKLVIDRNKNFELIIIDNASTENVISYVKTFWTTINSEIPLILEQEFKPGKVFALEKGFHLANGNYIIICDDDNELSINYLNIGLQYFENNPQIGVLGGRGILGNIENIPDWFERYAYNFACAPQALKTGNVYPERNVVYGAGMWIKKDAYLKTKKLGFEFIFNFTPGERKFNSKNIGGEDGELCWAIKYLGYEIWYAENLIFKHNISRERLNLEQAKILNKGMEFSGPYSSLYYRIWNTNNNNLVKCFWIKEIIYSLIHLLKLLIQSKNYISKSEIKRTYLNIKIYLLDRKKFDEKYNQIMNYKLKCIEHNMDER